MSLVPYTSSDISDSEEENDETENNTINNQSINTPDNNLENDRIILPRTEDSDLFTFLPQPKQSEINNVTEEQDDEFLHKKVSENLIEKPKKNSAVKIILPALSELPEEPDNVPKKIKLTIASKKTGLFSILPPPRGAILGSTNKSLIPRSVQQKPALSKPKPTKVANKSPLKLNPIIKTADVDDDNDTEIESSDFFSLDAPQNIQTEPIDILEPVRSTQVNSVRTDIIQPEVHSITDDYTSNTAAEPATEENFIALNRNDTSDNNALDEEALRRLCGRRERIKGMPVEILEIDEEQVRPSPSEWLHNSLVQETSEVQRPISNTGGPSGIHKRKHQITYLAHQAKANEQQLKNTWAQNRLTRKQTQAKYGF